MVRIVISGVVPGIFRKRCLLAFNRWLRSKIVATTGHFVMCNGREGVPFTELCATGAANKALQWTVKSVAPFAKNRKSLATFACH